MLVLTRLLGQDVFIDVPPSPHGRRVRLTVVRVDRNRVKLGFEADREVAINRSEVLGDQPPPGDTNEDTPPAR